MAKIKNIFVITLVAFLMYLSNGITAQNPYNNPVKIGGGVEQYLSGNGLGTFYSGYLTMSKGKNAISIGLPVQKRSMLMQGLKIGYSRVLTGGDQFAVDCEGNRVDNRLQLNAFGYIQYVKNMPLSYNSTIIEERTNRNTDFNWSKLRLSTAEMCFGFELYLKINQNISWKNYVGTSVYYHLNYKAGMYQEKIAPVLMIGTAIHIKHFGK